MSKSKYLMLCVALCLDEEAVNETIDFYIEEYYPIDSIEEFIESVKNDLYELFETEEVDELIEYIIENKIVEERLKIKSLEL